MAKTKEELLSKLVKTYTSKNKDYGNSADKTYKLFGDQAYLIRIHDKLARIERLISAEAEVKDESIEDTIHDLIVYTAMWQSVDCKPRIVGLSDAIHQFLNMPYTTLDFILDNMPERNIVSYETLQFIEDYINQL